MRYLVIGGVTFIGAGIGLTLLGMLWLGKRSDQITAGFYDEHRPPQHTVVWRHVEQMRLATRGTITVLDEEHILVSDDDNWPVIINRADIVEVLP